MTDRHQQPPPIAVRGRIYELPDLWEGKDDWTGVTSTAERKKRQNRLNQRAYRRRKKLEALGRSESISEDQSTPSIASPSKGDAPTKLEDSPGDIEEVPRYSPVEFGTRQPEYPNDSQGHLFQTSLSRRTQTQALIRQAYQNAMLKAPRPESLQMLIRINVTNACARNAARMGFPIEGLCCDDYISPFNSQGPQLDERWETLPESLRPTALQRSVVHHPWLDLFPFPRMRDNMLRAFEDGFDDDELCWDIMEIFHADSEDRPTLIVWGESWDGMGWEASAPFLKKWGWLLEGCPEVLQSTNLWREKRGEKRFG